MSGNDVTVINEILTIIIKNTLAIANKPFISITAEVDKLKLLFRSSTAIA
jgi:hypothetical protein